jgi:thiamine-monophosphate kinase
MVTLLDLGERNILRTIIPRYAEAAGDDCAIVSVPKGQLIVTTDPVPPPAARVIGGDSDPYWMGWLLVTINASDLAAAGATPLAFVAALEMPASTQPAELERLLTGIKDACRFSEMPYVGGNLREAPSMAGVGTAIGICQSYAPLTRAGAKPGDILVSIGLGGLFWRDAFRVIGGGSVPNKDASNLFRPKSQIAAIHQLAKLGLLSAAMDNSDGLLPTLAELADKNNCAAELNVASLQIAGLSADEQGDAARLWMGWGDWNIIATISPDRLNEACAIAKKIPVEVVQIGTMRSAKPAVVMRGPNSVISAPRLESERFAPDSWMMKGGIDEYARMIKSVQLPN